MTTGIARKAAGEVFSWSIISANSKVLPPGEEEMWMRKVERAAAIISHAVSEATAQLQAENTQLGASLAQAEQDEAGLIVERNRLQAENAKLREIAKGMHEALREDRISIEGRYGRHQCRCTFGSEGDETWSDGQLENHVGDCPARPDALENKP